MHTSHEILTGRGAREGVQQLRVRIGVMEFEGICGDVPVIVILGRVHLQGNQGDDGTVSIHFAAAAAAAAAMQHDGSIKQR